LLIQCSEPLFELGGAQDALGSRDPGAAVDKLGGVLEGAAAGVVKGDVVDEATVDR